MSVKKYDRGECVLCYMAAYVICEMVLLLMTRRINFIQHTQYGLYYTVYYTGCIESLWNKALKTNSPGGKYIEYGRQQKLSYTLSIWLLVSCCWMMYISQESTSSLFFEPAPCIKPVFFQVLLDNPVRVLSPSIWLYMIQSKTSFLPDQPSLNSQFNFFLLSLFFFLFIMHADCFFYILFLFYVNLLHLHTS